MARDLGLYLFALLAFTSLATSVASADHLIHNIPGGPLVALLLLVMQPLLLWAVAGATEA